MEAAGDLSRGRRDGRTTVAHVGAAGELLLLLLLVRCSATLKVWPMKFQHFAIFIT